ncbi:MAG: hypothetical protein ACLPVI_02580 [Dehalococcoidales bacterium]
MRKQLFRIFAAFAVVSLLTVFISLPVFADSGTNLSVSVQILDVTIAPGHNLTQPITVGSSGGVNLTAEVDGLTQTAQGASGPVQPAQDTGTNSARTFISLDKTSINLAAGASQVLTATISVPANTTPGERYACIYIYSAPGQGGVSIVAGILIPVIVTTAGFTPSYTGNIISLSCFSNPSTTSVYTGKAVDFDTAFNNTGNCRITGAENTVTVKDSSGNTKWQNQMAVPAPSLLPQTPRIIDNQYNVGLSAGNYTVKSDVTMANGTLLATKTISFSVANPPPTPLAPTPVAPGNSTSPGTTISTLTPNFQWNTVSGADYYTLNVSRVPYSTSNLVYVSDQLTGTSFTLPAGYLFNGQQYCWQMTATNITGNSLASNTFYFQTSGTYGAPAVTTMNAVDITATSATLNGKLTSLGSSGMIKVTFAYGTSTSYGTSTAILALTTTGVFQTSITGLAPNTIYHFQANAGGVSVINGGDLTFTTLAGTTTTSTATTTTSVATTTTSTISTTATTPVSSTTTVATTIPSAAVTTTAADLSADRLPPAILASSLAGLSFNNDPNPYLNATQQADTEVNLTGVSGSGSIVAAKYGQPSNNITFSVGTIKGGTGKTAVKYVGVSIAGYANGTAQVTVHYNNSEIGNFDPNSLSLYYYSGNKWLAFENISISADNSTVSGNIPISELSGNIIGLGGNLLQSANGVPVIQNNSAATGTGISWSLFGIVIASVLVVGGLVILVVRNSRKRQVDN